MKLRIVLLATSLTALFGCEQSNAPADPATAKGWKPAVGTSPMPAEAAPASQPATAGVKGVVVETMNSGGYTYVQVDAGGRGKVWAAGPVTAVKVGDVVGFSDGMVMADFQSKTLNRTFDAIYFVGAFEVTGGGAAPASMPAEKKTAPAAVEVGQIDKVEGGATIAELFAQSAALAGKQVKLRGKVVKYNGGIMGKNWLHLQDGTGAAGSNDLVVTTAATTEVGAVVVVEGVLTTNKDFGSGYQFAVMIEDATLTK